MRFETLHLPVMLWLLCLLPLSLIEPAKCSTCGQCEPAANKRYIKRATEREWERERKTKPIRQMNHWMSKHMIIPQENRLNKWIALINCFRWIIHTHAHMRIKNLVISWHCIFFLSYFFCIIVVLNFIDAAKMLIVTFILLPSLVYRSRRVATANVCHQI